MPEGAQLAGQQAAAMQNIAEADAQATEESLEAEKWVSSSQPASF
jgi:hypothetical protein